MAESWSILKLLNWTQEYFSKKDIPQARLDAEVLLAFALKLKRMDLYLQFERELSSDELATYKALIQRRIQKEPIAAITGVKEFWSRTFRITRDVLIPRPETEIIVETILAQKKEFKRILDVGTGSGILAITLGLEFPQAQITALDISQAAIEVAQNNAQKLGCPNCDFKNIDMLQFIQQDHAAFDLIVSNPPYIASAEIATLMPDVSQFEPLLALDGGLTGLDFYAPLATFAQKFLNPEGEILVEIGETQAEAVKEIFEKAGLTNVSIVNDYAKLARVVRGSV